MRRVVSLVLSALLVGSFVLPARATPGVNGERIKIGLHAPLTGAAPVPSDSVEKGKDLYFRWLEHNGITIHGRNVRVILKNDQYNPSAAVAVCKEMINQNNVFMLTGFTGADQMQACARFAESVGAPYAGPGTQTQGLKFLDHYFSTSAPWPRQARLLSDFLVSKGARGEKNGVVYYGTPSHSQAHNHFIRGMDDRRADVHYNREIARTAGTTEARVVVQEMRAAGIENVFILTSPVFFLQVLDQADTEGFHPLWTGIGLTMTFDTVAQVACRNDDAVRARFFSAFPAFADRARFDPNFDRAVALFHSGNGDDFMWQLWAQSRVLREMLEQAGKRLTRDRFASAVERSTIRTGIVPKLVYRPNDHFGGAAVHVLKMDCARERWVTTKTFARAF